MKGILLKEPLFHQTLKGLKTQTRRKLDIEPQSDFSLIDTPGHLYKGDDDDGNPIEVEKPLVAWFNGEFYFKNFGWSDHGGFTPRYNIGEVVYIKEPTAKDSHGNLVYQYSLDKACRNNYKWGNKMFMPAKDARHHIKILDIGVERIFDISEASVKAEGLDLSFDSPKIEFYIEKISRELGDGDYSELQLKFFNLFKQINPKTPLNSWVWVYHYELIKL